MKKMILTEADGVRFNIDTSYEHSIDCREYKAYYEYFFTPYAALRNDLFNKYGECLQIGTNETPALRFKRKELRIKLLQKIHVGHELSEELFIAMGLTKANSATVFNTDTLSWKMVSDIGHGENDKLPGKDFASLFEKIFHLSREEAWLLAWALLRAAYAEYWPFIDTLLNHLSEVLKASKGKKKDEAKTAFLSALESQILWLKTEVTL